MSNDIIFSLDDIVEGNYRGRGRWYKGKISRIDDNGTYDISYDDGEKECSVNADMIKRFIFTVGARVEVNYRGRGVFFKGKISAIRDDDQYDIAYDDGETESLVSNVNIKSLIEEFPSWSLNEQKGPIILNGIAIDSILVKIAEQIAILKDRSVEAKENSVIISSKLDVDEKTIGELAVDIKTLKEKVENVANINRPPIQSNDPPIGSNIDSELFDKQFNVLNQKLVEIIDKMVVYDSMLSEAKEENVAKAKKIDQLEDMIQKLTIKANTNEKTIESNKSQNLKDLKDLKDSSQTLSTKIDGNSNKIEELSSAINSKNNSDLKFEEYDKNFEMIQKKVEDMESKIFSMGDTYRVVENRVKQFENIFNQLLEQVAASKENIDSLGARVEYELTDRLNRLDRDKADRTEMILKADSSLLAAKSDYSEITRIDDIIQELNRRIMAQRKEMLENMTSLQKDFTNRSENIASWCLKQLRKEMKKDKNDGGDIGKVRCLVCDQVVDQNRDTDIVHSRERELHSNMKLQKMTNAQQQAAKTHAERPASAGAQLTKEYERNNPEIKKKSGMKPLRDFSSSPANEDRQRSMSPPTIKKSPDTKKGDQFPNINNDPHIVNVNGNVNFVSGDREYLGITQLQFSQSASYFKDLETRFTGGNKNKMLANTRPMSAGNPHRKK